MISVSCLDNDGYDWHFGNGKCKITFNNACVGLAILQNELYLLSLRDDENVVYDDGNVACDNKNVSSSENERDLTMCRRNYGTVVEGENRKTS